jgi:hypothetical protein
MSNTKIILNHQTDLILTNAQIVGASGIVKADLPGLVDDLAGLNSSISIEAQRASDAETKLEGELFAATDARISADASLQTQINFIINNTDETALDSLSEIVAAFQSADGDINGAITNLAGAAGSDLSAEIVARTSADSSLETVLFARHNSQQEFIESQISAEQSSRIDKDASLETVLFARHNSQQEFIESQISTEIVARTSADSSLETVLFARHNSQQEFIESQISTEIVARTSADSSLETVLFARHNSQQEFIESQISTEIAARTSKDESLETVLFARHNSQQEFIESAINNEESARIDGDQSLQNQIDFITNNTDPAAIDSLTEVVAAFQEADNDLNSAITNLSNAATSGLSAEISDRIAGDEALTADLSNLQSYVDTTVNTAIDTLTADLSTEEASRIAGDAAIQSSIDEMAVTDDTTIEIDLVANKIRLKETIAAPASGVRTFEGDVKASVQPDTLESYDASSYITKGILDSTNANVGTLSSELSTEAARAQAAEASIQSELAAMPSTDDTTIEIGDNNVIRLKEYVAAPASGVRAFEGVIKATVQPDTLESYDASSYITKGILDVTVAEVGVVSANLSIESARAQAAEASIQATLDAMPSTDNTTLEINPDTQVIRLKETVAAPASGVRTFEGDVKAAVQPDTLESYNPLSFITREILENAIEDEAILREAADAELDSRIVDIISNTDLTSVDSFTELIDKVNEVTASNFNSVYAKKVEVTFNGTETVTLATPVKAESMMLYINGLMVDNGDDYTEIIENGFVIGATLIGDAFTVAAAGGSKLNAYGVHGTFSNISF